MPPSYSESEDDDGGGSDVCHQAFGEFACLNLAGLPLILCSILLCLVFLILLLEQGIHALKHSAQKSRFWRKFWEALEGELIMLGLLSFSLFLLTQGLTGTKDESLEHFITLIEFVHIILFITMITYICVIARSGQVAQRWISRMRMQQKNFQRLQKIVDGAERVSFWETLKSCCTKNGDGEGEDDEPSQSESMSESESYSKFASQIFKLALDSEDRKNKRCCRSPLRSSLMFFSWIMCCCVGRPLRRGKVWFSRARLSFGRGKGKRIDVYMVATQFLLCDAFLRSQNLPVDLPFDFVEYTSKATTHMFVKMVKLGWRLWTIFLTFVLGVAALSGIYHKINGNVVESTDTIFTDDPDDNLVFYNTFFTFGYVLLFYNFRSISTTDTTFEKLIQLEMKRIRKRERQAAERAAGSGTESVTDPLNESHASSLGLPLLSPQRDPNTTASTVTTTDVSLGLNPDAKWLCVRLNGKSGQETFCPCTVHDISPYKKLFFNNAPDWCLRIYQATVLYYGLFLSTYVTVFAFLSTADATYTYFSLILPLVAILAAGQAFPKYASVRYFGDLSRPEILDPLVEEAWEKYRNGERRIQIDNPAEVEAIRSMYELVCGEEIKKV
ncbi:hypothetical protein TrVE_jg11412 [Triparma verrucosa]|uniref:Uncharacterized protein n=1 Tax=Triparma verrucosa TaxID=1606542 RepID=A0A9W7KRA9_9STRA|nr:hypothetical protein TrVE_jg11412 [Triparma verrucosa]